MVEVFRFAFPNDQDQMIIHLISAMPVSYSSVIIFVNLKKHIYDENIRDTAVCAEEEQRRKYTRGC